MNDDLLHHFALRQPLGDSAEPVPEEALIDRGDLDQFLKQASQKFDAGELADILRRAVKFTLQPLNAEIEVKFISIYAALESVLTYLRRHNHFMMMSEAEFSQFERELRAWLKQYPLLKDDGARRALIYEKIRELNRFPFGHIFKEFCARYALDLSDLWPVLGNREEWPLMEIRHRLVHGDPFASRPGEAMICACDHLRWVVERMLLSVFEWPISRSNVSSEYLENTSWMYKQWQAERAKFA